MHTSKVIWELAQKKETLKYSGKLWQNEERAPSCGLIRDIPVNRQDIHYDVTDQAKQAFNDNGNVFQKFMRDIIHSLH